MNYNIPKTARVAINRRALGRVRIKQILSDTFLSNSVMRVRVLLLSWARMSPRTTTVNPLM